MHIGGEIDRRLFSLLLIVINPGESLARSSSIFLSLIKPKLDTHKALVKKLGQPGRKSASSNCWLGQKQLPAWISPLHGRTGQDSAEP